MASAKRVSDEPAFVLHSYDWSESSLILEVFTRHRGRVALAAKGVKRPTSNFRPVLLPLQPLSLSYSLGGEGNGEIHTLKGAEWVGGHVMPQGDALLSGLYLNELLMRLLAEVVGTLGPDKPVPSRPATIINPAIRTNIEKFFASKPSSISSLVNHGWTSTSSDAQTDNPSRPAIARRCGRTKPYSQASAASSACGSGLSTSLTIKRRINCATV